MKHKYDDKCFMSMHGNWEQGIKMDVYQRLFRANKTYEQIY